MIISENMNYKVLKQQRRSSHLRLHWWRICFRFSNKCKSSKTDATNYERWITRPIWCWIAWNGAGCCKLCFIRGFFRRKAHAMRLTLSFPFFLSRWNAKRYFWMIFHEAKMYESNNWRKSSFRRNVICSQRLRAFSQLKMEICGIT